MARTVPRGAGPGGWGTPPSLTRSVATWRARGPSGCIVTRVTPDGTQAPARRADRRGADDDPARRHGRVDDDAHARATTTSWPPASASPRACSPARPSAACATAPTARPWPASSTTSPSRPAAGRRRRRRGSARRRRAAGGAAATRSTTLLDRLAPLPPTPPIDPTVLAAVPGRVLDGQGLFDDDRAPSTPPPPSTATATILADPRGRRPPQRRRQGGRRAAARRARCRRPVAACSSAAGRRSRWCRRRGRPASRTLVAVSAPTALAVHAARRAGLDAGRVRPRRRLQPVRRRTPP